MHGTQGRYGIPRKFVFENIRVKVVLGGLCLGEEGAVDSGGIYFLIPQSMLQQVLFIVIT